MLERYCQIQATFLRTGNRKKVQDLPGKDGAGNVMHSNLLELIIARYANGMLRHTVFEYRSNIISSCIPKMDHHCPWTVNCVSHITYPHFLRFVGYADLAIIYLEYFLYVRAAIVWEDRDMPSVSYVFTSIYFAN